MKLLRTAQYPLISSIDVSNLKSESCGLLFYFIFFLFNLKRKSNSKALVPKLTQNRFGTKGAKARSSASVSLLCRANAR